MQLFFPRISTSITRNSNHCCFSSVTAINTNYNTCRLLNTAGRSPRTLAENSLKRRFGEFYKRFYSTMSGGAVVGGVHRGAAINFKPAAIGTGQVEESRTQGRRRRRKRAAERMKAIADTEQTKQAEKKNRRLHSTEKPLPKEERVFIEKSITTITNRFLQHNRLCSELRAEIKSRRSIPPKRSLAEEVELLKRTLRYVTTHHYEPSPPPPDPPTETDTTAPSPMAPPPAEPSSTEPARAEPSTGLKTSTLKPTPVPWFSPYLPPFPNYNSPDPAHPLNSSLARLLGQRPPSPAIIPRICYNLLTSSSAPNIYTYNVLIEGLTRVRDGSLAHIVFRNLVNGGLGPKGRPTEDTIVRMLNLCVKTGDRAGFDKIVKITARRNMATWIGRDQYRVKKKPEQKRRSRQLFEMLITGAARFGDVQQVRVWLRAMTRECPDNPHPGVYMLTSLMRMWTEMKDWDRGLRCWREMRGPDLRAFRQMVKLCRECKKPQYEKRVLDAAELRGWKEEVMEPIRKTKGLPLRKENKTPHIRAQRYLPKATVTPPPGLDAFTGALERTWKATLNTTDSTDPEDKLKQAVPRSKKRSSIGAAARSRIWDDVISRRMNDIRPSEVSGDGIREALARKRQAAQDHHDGGQ